MPVVVPWSGEDAFAPPPDVQRRLDPHVQRLRRAGVNARALTAIGPTVETINAVAEGEQADLVAMSTHARTGLSHALWGSITEQVLRTSGRPLLVSARGR